MPEVGLEEAALRLGISPDSVRKRIRRGRLEGRPGADGRLLVVLPDDPARPPRSGQPPDNDRTTADNRGQRRPPLSGQRTDNTGQPPDTDRQATADETGQLAHLEALLEERDKRIAVLEESIADLRRQVEAAARRLEADQQAEHELRQLLAREQQAHAEARIILQALLPKLSAGDGSSAQGPPDSSVSEPSPAPKPPRSWWPFWRSASGHLRR